MRWALPFVVVAIALAGGCKSEKSSDSSGARKRVVTLTPSATELVASAAGVDYLVGVDRYSDYPAEVTELPKVGDFLSPNVELIVRLKPDLVVLDDVQSRVVEALQSAGIETLALPMHTIEHVKAGLVAVGDALGTRATADKVIAGIDESIDRAREAAAKIHERPRVLMVVDRELGGLGSLVAAGPGSYLDEMLAIGGGENVLASAGVRYPKISPEEVLRADPQVVLDAVHTDDAKLAVADWSAVDIAAVRNDRVFVVNDRRFVTPTPRLGEALVELERMLHGGR